MQLQEIGTSGVQAARIGLGVMRMAKLSQSEANAAVAAALAQGINFFDTADIYTAGESSRKLAKAFAALKTPRESVCLQTKVGIRKHTSGQITYDFSRDYLLQAVDEELKNLQVDQVDFLLLHRPDTLVELDELAEVLAQLSQSGKVAHFGLSNVTPMQVELFQSISPVKFEVNQLQFGLGHAGMIHQEFHANMSDAASIDHDGGILAYSRLKKMTIQAWSPLQYGFFYWFNHRESGFCRTQPAAC